MTRVEQKDDDEDLARVDEPAQLDEQRATASKA